MDNTILAPDAGRTDATSQLSLNATPESEQNQQEFGGVFNKQLHKEDSQTVQPTAPAVAQAIPAEPVSPGALPAESLHNVAVNDDTKPVADNAAANVAALQAAESLVHGVVLSASSPQPVSGEAPALKNTAANVVALHAGGSPAPGGSLVPGEMLSTPSPQPVPSKASVSQQAANAVDVAAAQATAAATAAASTTAQSTTAMNSQLLGAEDTRAAAPLLAMQASLEASPRGRAKFAAQGTPVADDKVLQPQIAHIANDAVQIDPVVDAEADTLKLQQSKGATAVVVADGSSNAALTAAKQSGLTPLLTGDLASSMLQTLPAMERPLGDGQWPNAFGQRITWALGQGVQAASLALNPKELGPVTVQINVQDDVARLHFNAAHSQARDAIESALPQLRQMLHVSGIAMGQVDISGEAGAGADHSGAQQQSDTPTSASSTSASTPSLNEDPLPVAHVEHYTSRGLVDTFV